MLIYTRAVRHKHHPVIAVVLFKNSRQLNIELQLDDAYYGAFITSTLHSSGTPKSMMCLLCCTKSRCTGVVLHSEFGKYEGDVRLLIMGKLDGAVGDGGGDVDVDVVDEFKARMGSKFASKYRNVTPLVDMTIPSDMMTIYVGSMEELGLHVG